MNVVFMTSWLASTAGLVLLNYVGPWKTDRPVRLGDVLEGALFSAIPSIGIAAAVTLIARAVT